MLRSLICIVHCIIDILETQNFSEELHMRGLQHLQNTENNVKQLILKSVKDEKCL